MTFSNITPKAAYEKMTKEGYRYLDVRTVEEFEDGHAKGSVNIPLIMATPQGKQQNPKFVEEVKGQFPQGTKLVIGCHSGGRSAKACAILNREGYPDVFNIDAGFGGSVDQTGWMDEGLPVE